MRCLRSDAMGKTLFAMLIVLSGLVFAETGNGAYGEGKEMAENETAHVLPILPYAENALEPVISALHV